jgi:hypothetical protein
LLVAASLSGEAGPTLAVIEPAAAARIRTPTTAIPG